MDATNLRQINVAGAIDFDVGIEVYLAPHADADFIARPDHVIGGHRNLVNGRKGGGDAVKQILAEDRENLTGGRRQHFLEFGQRLAGE